jgi:hypothetical protein
MNKKYLAHGAFALAAALLSAALGNAQTAQTQAAPSSPASASQTAKPSPYQNPYQGVSTPPADDTILTTDDGPPAQPKPPAAPPATAHAANADPDAGLVVTKPESDDSADGSDDSSDAGSRTPALKNRPAEAAVDAKDDADDDIVTYLPGPANALPEGTAFRVRMLEGIDADDTVPGKPFRASLCQDLLHDGRIVVPYGSELRGKIVYTTYGRRIGGRSVIHLRADEFILPDGTHYALHAQVIDTQGSDTKVIGEGNIAAKDHPKVLLTEAAIATGGGALVGAKLGGPAGAAVGSAVGAGVIGAHWLMTDHSAYVPAQSTVTFSLTDPMFLTPSHE